MAAGVSVALCTFQSEAYLEAQLASILAQSVLPSEVVIGDDGSTDASLEIVRGFAARAPFEVRVLPRSDSRGVVHNFQRTLEATAHETILLSDHDDVWFPHRVAASLEALKSGFEAIHADAAIIDRHGSETGDRLLALLRADEATRKDLTGGRCFDLYLRRNFATGATMAVRRHLVDIALPIPAGWVHDEWLAMVAASRDTLALVDEPLIQYRLHGANAIGASRPTLRRRVQRTFTSGQNRNRTLSIRAASLEARAPSLGLPANSESHRLTLIRNKATFERLRAELPSSRMRRVSPVAKLATGSDYSHFASQGWLDILRDLCQAAEPHQ